MGKGIVVGSFCRGGGRLGNGFFFILLFVVLGSGEEEEKVKYVGEE